MVEPADGWDVEGVTHVALVPFAGERIVVLRVRGGHAAVGGTVRPSEHWCVTATRLLQEAGVRLDQDAPGPLVHPFGVLRTAGEVRVTAWCEVEVADALLIDPDEAAGLLAPDEAAFCRRASDLRGQRVDDAVWMRDKVRLLEEHYLRSPTPEGQSGKHGDAADWELARRLVVRPAHHDGTFLDLGCANGLLMESVHRWGAEAGRRLEPYGLDASERLVALARRRLPHWRDRFFVGDALTWTPPRRFDFVHTMVDLVPPRRRPEWLRRVVEEVVAPGGRLIVRDYQGIGDRLRSWGLPVAGATVQERGARQAQEAAWLDTPG
jgi:2-polyprenyl-3-methyl-5-hydroxy-6-metoxy-1,4-benzoquinol methylase